MKKIVLNILVIYIASFLFTQKILCDVNQDFLKAASDLDLPNLKASLKLGADINARDTNGRTALLLVSCDYSHGFKSTDKIVLDPAMSIVKYLLDQPNININAKDNKGRYALGCIINKWQEYGKNTVKLFLKHKEPELDVNLQDNNGNTALMFASARGEYDIVKLLLEHKNIKINAKDKVGGTALMDAIRGHYVEVVKLLLKQPEIEINAKDNDGRSALIWASKEGNEEIVKLLLKQPEIEINAKDNKGKTALDSARTPALKLKMKSLIEKK